MSKGQNQEPARVLEPGELSNEDLLRVKSSKGIAFSEAVLLRQVLERVARINWRKYGNADQKANFSKAEISTARSEGKKGFANETIFKFYAV